MAILDDIQRAKRVLSSRLLRLGLRGGVTAMGFARSVTAAVAAAGKNVHAVGVGRKMVEGRPTGDLCVRLVAVHSVRRYDIGESGSAVRC